MLIDPALAACPVVYPMPAVVSSLCCGAFNLATFRFCGECGTQRPRVGALPDKLSGCVDWARVQANADRFAGEAAGTAHRTADDSTISSFAAFLSSLPNGGIDIMQAKPGHVVLYLGYRTSHTAAQTVMHDIACAELPGCGCPKMMKYSTLESLLRRLRRNLSEQAGCGDTHTDCPRTGLAGNPAAAPEVTRWVTAYTAAQKRAGITTTEVTPVFSFDTAKFALQCDSEFQGQVNRFYEDNDPGALRQSFLLLRMYAFALVDGATGQRPGDLAQTLCKRVISFPSGDGYILNFVSGKTYKDGHMFGLHRDSTSLPTCGFTALQRYFTFCEHVLGWNMTGEGYVFMDVKADGHMKDARLASPFKVATASTQLSALMKRAGVEGHHTMSGYRAGTAIRNALMGESLMSCMDSSYWKSGRTALHYLKLMEVLGHSGLKAKAKQETNISEAEYENIMSSPLRCVADLRR